MTVPEDKQKGEAVKCSACGHLNAKRQSRCESCGVHLYVSCRRCGRGNERTLSRCVECGSKLHRSWVKRSSGRLFGVGRQISVIQIVLLVLAILVGFLLVIKLAGFSSPPPE